MGLMPLLQAAEDPWVASRVPGGAQASGLPMHLTPEATLGPSLVHRAQLFPV